MVIFAERLKYLRERRGLMQKAVAVDLNIGNTTLSNYEKDISSPSPEMLVAIADYFNTSIDYLLGRTNNSAPISSSVKEEEKYISTVCHNLNDENKKSLFDYAEYLSQKYNKNIKKD